MDVWTILALIVIIFVAIAVIKIINKICEWISGETIEYWLFKKPKLRREELERAAQERERAEQYAREKAQAIAQQNALVEKFKNSPLTKEILREITYDDNLPETIVVYDDKVQGTTNGRMLVYDFRVHRVGILKSVNVLENTDKRPFDRDNVVCEQYALARAIALLLGDEYELDESANIEHISEPFTYSTGLTVYRHDFSYNSKNITLKLKAKRTF